MPKASCLRRQVGKLQKRKLKNHLARQLVLYPNGAGLGIGIWDFLRTIRLIRIIRIIYPVANVIDNGVRMITLPPYHNKLCPSHLKFSFIFYFSESVIAGYLT